LASYGFVPKYKQGCADGDHHVAEVYMDGVRYEVGPTTIPQDMVVAMSDKIHPRFEDEPPDPEITLTPHVAIRLAKRISDAAFEMLLHSVEDPDSQSAEEIISSQLAASLRWNQHRILVACSLGLRDYAVGEQSQ